MTRHWKRMILQCTTQQYNTAFVFGYILLLAEDDVRTRYPSNQGLRSCEKSNKNRSDPSVWRRFSAQYITPSITRRMKSNVSLMTSQVLIPQWKSRSAWQQRRNDASCRVSRRVQSKIVMRKQGGTNAISEARVVKLETAAANTATAILAIQQQQNSYVQVIDNKGDAYQVKFQESLTQFSTELTRVITPLKDELKQEMNPLKDELKQEMNLKLAELRIWIITTGMTFIAAILTLLVSGWEKLYSAVRQVSGGSPNVVLLCLIVVSWGVYCYFENNKKTISRLEARVQQLSQAQGTAASNVSPA